MAELVTLSASKLKTYQSCARKYWYSYVKREETPKHPAAMMGIAVHKTIETTYKQGGDPVTTYGTVYSEELERHGIAPELHYYKDGMKMVAMYDYAKRTPVEMELEFNLPFPNQADALCNIRGYLDQLYPEGFVDLKTNKRKPIRGVLDNDLQFIIYAWAFKELVGYDPTMVFWHQLRTGEDLAADVVGKVDEATRFVERILDSEMTGIYDKSVGEACMFCSFREPCLGRTD